MRMLGPPRDHRGPVDLIESTSAELPNAVCVPAAMYFVVFWDDFEDVYFEPSQIRRLTIFYHHNCLSCCHLYSECSRRNPLCAPAAFVHPRCALTHTGTSTLLSDKNDNDANDQRGSACIGRSHHARAARYARTRGGGARVPSRRGAHGRCSGGRRLRNRHCHRLRHCRRNHGDHSRGRHCHDDGHGRSRCRYIDIESRRVRLRSLM